LAETPAISNGDRKTGMSCIRAPGCKCDKFKHFYDEAGNWDEVKASHAVSRPDRTIVHNKVDDVD
jgi:hypothetical protein